MSSHACVFVNPSCTELATILQKNKDSNQSIATHRHVISCVCSGKPIATIYKRTKHQTPSNHSIKQRIAMSSHACVFVNPSCNYFTKGHSVKPEHGIPDFISFMRHETPFSDQKGASKIGDSVLCIKPHYSNASPCHLMCV